MLDIRRRPNLIQSAVLVLAGVAWALSISTQFLAGDADPRDLGVVLMCTGLIAGVVADLVDSGRAKAALQAAHFGGVGVATLLIFSS